MIAAPVGYGADMTIVVAKPFHSSQKAIHKSGSTGRKGRGKMPF